MQRSLRFCFDYLSAYAYLAWTQMGGIAERHGCVLEPVPVLFAALLQAHGTRGPAEVPARRRYVIKDAARKAHTFGVPINAPFAHPFNPLLLLRLSSLPLPGADRLRMIDAFFRATWVERKNITDPAVVGELLRSVGLDAGLVELASTAESKERLRAQTAGVITLGTFGIPTTLVEGELFWGTDALADLECFLEGRDPVPPTLVEQWESLPAAAQRPGSGAR